VRACADERAFKACARLRSPLGLKYEARRLRGPCGGFARKAAPVSDAKPTAFGSASRPVASAAPRDTEEEDDDEEEGRVEGMPGLGCRLGFRLGCRGRANSLGASAWRKTKRELGSAMAALQWGTPQGGRCKSDRQGC